MRPKLYSVAAATHDPDGIVDAQTATGAGTLSATGALVASGVATFDIPRHALITATGDNSGVDFTFVGTDRRDIAITETVTGPNATTVATTLNYKTITSVSVDGATTGPVNVGSADEWESQWFPLDHYQADFNVGIQCDVTGTMTYTVQLTNHDVFEDGFQENDATAHNHGTLAGETTDQNGVQTTPATALRFQITGAGASSSLNARFLQSGQ